MPESIPHVLILGGGFGGLATATEIRKSFSSSQVKITVIDKKDWFMVGFAKLWIIRGTRNFEDSIGFLNNLSKKGINFVKDEILGIDCQNKKVETKNKTFSYDYLVVAMGASLSPQNIPGLYEYGLNLYDHDQLKKINQKLRSFKSGKIAIVISSMPYKCPPAPFEAGLLIDSLLRENGARDSVQIHFYSPAPVTLPVAGTAISQKILDLINSRKIEFHGTSKVKSVTQNKIEFEQRKESFDLLLAVPPHVAPKVIYEAGLAERGGFIPIDRNCKTRYEDVYAVGDVTTLTVDDKIAIPKAGVFAEGEGSIVAKTIISKIQENEKNYLFDGKGACFIESGNQTASLIEVDMFAKPKPLTNLTESTKKHLEEKFQFEKERLEKWL